MKKIMKWFCFFMFIYGIVVTIQINQQSYQSLVSNFIRFIILFLLGFAFIKLHINHKQDDIKIPSRQHDTTVEISTHKNKKNCNSCDKKYNDIINEDVLPFEKDYLNTALSDGKTVKEHMNEDFNEAIKQDQHIDDTDDEYINDFFNSLENEDIKSLENMMIIHEDKELLHPDEIIKKYEQGIAAYYELKKRCYSSKSGKKYFSEMWQHCHNSNNPDFDFVDSLKERYRRYKDNYEQQLESYNKTVETLKRVSNPLEQEIIRHYDPDAWYVRIDDRTNIYANETNTYISTAGTKCADFEESLLEYAEAYKQSLCPYCKQKIELPKRKKSCPLCKQKMYIVKGGIKQGNMVLKEEDKLKLYQLRDDFRTDKHYNPNYGGGIVVDDCSNLIRNE